MGSIIGIDVTGSPGPRKPLCAAVARLDGRRLRLERLEAWTDFGPFEAALAAPGPWLMALDTPFALPADARRDLGWPGDWAAVAARAGALGPGAFRAALESFHASQPAGRKYRFRVVDRAVGGASPLNTHYPPVALMFQAVAPRLAAARHLDVPGLRPVPGADRVAVEAYPALVARALDLRALGVRSLGAAGPYKDGPAADRARRLDRRAALVAALSGDAARAAYGIAMTVPPDLAEAMVDDRGGDHLDAALCALQGAWAWRHRDRWPAAVDPAEEGWVADPAAL